MTRRGWTAAWLAWIAAFVAIEWAALARGTAATLSAHVYRWFSVTEKRRWWFIRRAVLVGFLMWLTLHFLSGGQERIVMVEILKAIADPLLALLAPVIATLLTAVLFRWFKKLGLEVGAEEQAKTEKTVQDIILAVDEWARRQKKEGLEPTSVEKSNLGMTKMAEQLPSKTAEEAAQLLDQELPKVRAGVPDFPPAPAL